jgi:hypothetical protein
VYLAPCGSGYSWWPKTDVFNSWIDAQVDTYGLNPPLYAPKGCYDESLECAFWSQAGECRNSTYNEFMQQNCRLSCGLCDGVATMPSPPPPPSPSPQGKPPFRGCETWSYAYWVNRRCEASLCSVFTCRSLYHKIWKFI